MHVFHQTNIECFISFDGELLLIRDEKRNEMDYFQRQLANESPELLDCSIFMAFFQIWLIIAVDCAGTQIILTCEFFHLMEFYHENKHDDNQVQIYSKNAENMIFFRNSWSYNAHWVRGEESQNWISQHNSKT